MNPAYFETHFLQETPDSNWPAEFAIITAYETTGEKWSAHDNRAADSTLSTELQGLGVWLRNLTGHSPNTGHAEPGWAVAMSVDAACELGLRYKQDAIFYVSGDLLSVSYCDHRRKLVTVGPFRERVQYRPSNAEDRQ